jgi:hypothetical protein
MRAQDEDSVGKESHTLDPRLQGWRDIASRIKIDPRFPIPIEFEIYPVTGNEEVRIACVITTKDATNTGPNDCKRCILTPQDLKAHNNCPHLDEELWVELSRVVSIDQNNEQKVSEIEDFLYETVCHELGEFLRFDGKTVSNPHRTAIYPRRWRRAPRILSSHLSSATHDYLASASDPDNPEDERTD